MINIKRANKNELQDLQELTTKIFYDNLKYDPDFDMKWAQSEKGKTYFTDYINNPDSCFLIAEENHNNIGYVAAGPKSIPYLKSKYVEIEHMGVIPKYRSKGIGTLLINECLKWAKSQGFQKAFVNTYFTNTLAIAFYKRNGFSEIDISLEKNL